jgi:hypothetical protein
MAMMLGWLSAEADFASVQNAAKTPTRSVCRFGFVQVLLLNIQ